MCLLVGANDGGRVRGQSHACREESAVIPAGRRYAGRNFEAAVGADGGGPPNDDNSKPASEGEELVLFLQNEPEREAAAPEVAAREDGEGEPDEPRAAKRIRVSEKKGQGRGRPRND